MSEPGSTDQQGFTTTAVHAGYCPDAATGAVNVPIYATSTYVQDGVGGLRNGYEYSRTGNPTRAALEASLAALEAGSFGRVFGSGMAATDSVLRALVGPGQHVIIPDDAYGGTFRLVDKVLQPWGVAYSAAHIADAEAVRAAIRQETAVIWVESPTNPMLSIGDIPALAEIAHAAGAKLVVDNTFATPYLQRPLQLGADVVVHSTTKYLGGHSDVLGGAVITDDPQLDEAFGFLQNSVGAVGGPFDAYLTLRGIKTLSLRMERHCDNAEAVAEFASRQAAVRQVIYPGLSEHPGHVVADKQMRRFGGMVSLRLAGGPAAARELCGRTRLFTLAESLGGVESLLEYPAVMTHASTAGSQLEVPDDLVRLSVGIEDASDLIADLRQALN